MALDYNIIGERLKKARIDKNMTQEKLAEQIDVPVGLRTFSIILLFFNNLPVAALRRTMSLKYAILF